MILLPHALFFIFVFIFFATAAFLYHPLSFTRILFWHFWSAVFLLLHFFSFLPIAKMPDCFFTGSFQILLFWTRQWQDSINVPSLQIPRTQNQIGRQRACAVFPVIHLNGMKFLKSSKSKHVGAGYIPPRSLISVGLVVPGVHQNTWWLSLLGWRCRLPDTAVVFSGLSWYHCAMMWSHCCTMGTRAVCGTF